MKHKVIDTHVHIWDLDRGEYKWLLNDESCLNQSFSFEELVPSLEIANIKECLLVQADNNVEDTDRMLEDANIYEQIVGVVGWLPLENPYETRQLLEDRFLNEKYFKGVRHLIHNENDPRWMLRENVLESLSILSKYNIPYDIVGTEYCHLEAAIEVAEQLPMLSMVLDHLNQPPIKTKEQFGAWGELISKASEYENIYCKISGLGTASNNLTGWNMEDVEPYIAYVLDKFGSKKCFCGGDWPVSLLAGSYTNTWMIYQNILTKLLTDSELEDVFYKSAYSFYNLK
ncbi:amidohydrolase family protein [Sphingobacterium sp.]|uniref:amidohydrolase family protein n=1 Tax=Sphingobacterium sp. TaxID=341027 RepID=UPI0028A9E38C|nr:amidohydrolase family protein [Sphingobacterium sp.]